MRRRDWRSGALVIMFLAGMLFYGFMCYRVIMAGGLSPSSLRPTCTEAAIGSTDHGFRSTESVRLRRSYLPPSVACEWSGGSTAFLIPVDVLSWLGPGLVVGSLVGASVLRVAPRRDPDDFDLAEWEARLH